MSHVGQQLFVLFIMVKCLSVQVVIMLGTNATNGKDFTLVYIRTI